MQNNILELIQAVVGDKVKNLNFTRSFVGTVNRIEGRVAYIDIRNSGEITANIPQSLWAMVRAGDIVIIFDLYNNGMDRYVQGVVGSRNDAFNIAVWDNVNNVIISSIFDIYDTTTGQTVSTILRVD